MSYTPNEYAVNISRGRVTGSRPVSGYGLKTTAGADSGVLWPNGAFAFPASAGVQMSLVSTSANDTAAGTGVRTVRLVYLDANLAEQTEDVTLNGLVPVLTAATNIRFINCMFGLTFGSGAAAAGNITASNGGNTYSYIATAGQRCTSSVRMVPAGKRMIVDAMYAGSSSGAGAASAIITAASPNFEGVDYTTSNIFMPMASASFQDGSGGLTFPCPFAFTAGQSFGFTFTVDKAATVVGAWFGWLENA